MADQGKWFKLWESSLDDQDLENLSIHEWFCWARFGTYLKKHGKDGKIRLRGPATAVINLLRVNTIFDAIGMIKSFPNYAVEEMKSVTANVTDEFVTFNIQCLNWNKYQGDFSGDRVRRYRRRVTANVTAQEEKRRDVEEKRREETPKPPLASPLHSKSTANGQVKYRPADNTTSTLKINGKPYIPDPEIPDSERMTPEEMDAIKRTNMGPLPAHINRSDVIEAKVVAGGDDVF